MPRVGIISQPPKEQGCLEARVNSFTLRQLNAIARAECRERSEVLEEIIAERAQKVGVKNVTVPRLTEPRTIGSRFYVRKHFQLPTRAMDVIQALAEAHGMSESGVIARWCAGLPASELPRAASVRYTSSLKIRSVNHDRLRDLATKRGVSGSRLLSELLDLADQLPPRPRVPTAREVLGGPVPHAPADPTSSVETEHARDSLIITVANADTVSE
jgi:hypothetical protein